jgi:hypothetical protein
MEKDILQKLNVYSDYCNEIEKILQKTIADIEHLDKVSNQKIATIEKQD